jgi:hypothetical protein
VLADATPEDAGSCLTTLPILKGLPIKDSAMQREGKSAFNRIFFSRLRAG